MKFFGFLFGGSGIFCNFAASEMTNGWYSLKSKPYSATSIAAYGLLFFLFPILFHEFLYKAIIDQFSSY